MPPVTRRSQASGVSKRAAGPVFSKHVPSSLRQSSNSWDFLEPEETREEMDDEIASNQLAIREPAHLQDALDPLREMAERVGREVETFAENLDRFRTELPKAEDRFGAVVRLVDEYIRICEYAVSEAEEQHKKSRVLLLREEWREQHSALLPKDSTRGLFPSKESSLNTRQKVHVQRLRQWQQEADIWRLFRSMLDSHHNPDVQAKQQEKEETLARLGPPNRYTREQDLWTRFLLENDVAREQSMVKTWLEQTFDHQESDLEGIVKELEDKAGSGKGLWKHGWMHTREKIKGEKRLRSWPGSVDERMPKLQRTDNNELLVTALDPDASSRQNRTLEKPDAYFERALWIACWEMLRRGTSVEAVTGWLEEQHEGWRAISIGKATETSDVLSSAAWRKMCNLAADSGCSNEYEAAVYGLLGGNVKAVQKVCRSVDDHLYAYYTTTLTRQFDQYLASNFPHRIPSARRGLAFDAAQDPQQAIFELITKLRTQPATNAESVKPMKIVESYLLANDLDSLIYSLGHAISYTDSLRGGNEQMIVRMKPFWSHDGNLPEAEIVLDPQALRIVVHINIILNVLRNEPRKEEARDAEENVLVAYIQSLRAAGKRLLIPIYASRLSVGRWVVTTSEVMQDITDVKEQEETMKLLVHYGGDIILVLNEQMSYALNNALSYQKQLNRPLRMLETLKDTKFYPGQRIMAGFLPETTSKEDDSVVSSLQWYNLLSGHWTETFQALSLTLRKCLATGRLACAIQIVHEFPYDDISHRKSNNEIGKSINMMEYRGPPPADEAEKWASMARESRTYYELSLLVTAIEALANWRDLEQTYTIKRPKLTSAPLELKDAKKAVDVAMEPVLTDILCHGTDDDEKADLHLIRTAFIPEVVIAYNTVLHSAGSIITRNTLLESMDLSVIVAKDENRISECFVEAKRMRELVTSFAHTSKTMLLLKNHGRPWTARTKDREGKDLGMWEIGPQGIHGGASREISQAPPG